jgi:hypothetical protein
VEGASASDILIFGVVLGLRLLVPLAIPRYPLPGILGAFLLDGFDKGIFQRFTSLNLDFYQSYDKALDNYYLTIAYVSTLRNWTNLFSFKVSRFLFYFRLVGAVAFELSGIRAILLLFPNTFEFFFDFYELVRLRWDPRRLNRELVLRAAAFIWIVIKLPQEYIIHIAQVSAIDWIKVNIFGVEITASLTQAIANRPLVIVALVALATALVVGARWLLTHRLPPADRRPRLAADPIPEPVAERSRRIASSVPALRVTDPALIEKVALVSLVTIVFAEVLPGVQAGVLAVTAGVAFVIVANIALSIWLARRGRTWGSFGREFVGLAVVNTALILLYAALLPTRNESIDIWHALFFSLLLTLIVALYDRYRPIHVARFEKDHWALQARCASMS